MHRTLFALLVALAGCSGNTTTDPDGGAVADLAMPPDLALGADDREIVMAEFTVPAGGEVFKCQNFANPWGADAEVQQWESHMAKGSHHLLVFYQDNATNDPIEDCSGLEFHSGPFGAQTPDATVTYPTGVAALLKAGQGFRFASHYLNASSQPITAKVRVVMRKSPPGSVTQHAGIFFFNNVNIFVAADGMEHTITKTCTIPRDMTLLYATGHIHQHATNLTAMLDGTMLYTTDSWSGSPFTKYDPPLQVKMGQKVTFTCTYKSDAGGYLTFGESAKTNEMCIFDGQFFPNPDSMDVVCN